MTGVITYMLTFHRLPELDREGRTALCDSQRIQNKCYRSPHFDAGRFVEQWDEENANSIRNMMQLNLEIHDRIVHVYHLHALDWVNPVNALSTDHKATSELQQAVSPSHPLSSPVYFRDVRTRLKKVR